MAREDRSGEFTGVLGFFICICTLLVLLRCYCKLVIVKNFAADDYFSVLTLVSFLVFCTSALLGIQNGTGKRRYLIPDEKYPVGMKWWWTCEPTYVATNFFLKCSIGIFLLRIAVDRTHRIILWTALIAIQLYSVYFFFIFTFQCWPVSFYGYSALSCATDWTFSIVPIFIVHKLQMNKKKKMTVAVVLAFCAIGSTATVVRIPFINGLNDIPDFLYSTIDVAIWSTCETGIGLATSAAATLRPLLRQVFGDMSTHDSTSRKHSRMWNSGHPSRSGYREHASRHTENDIQLSSHDSKHHNHTVHVVGGDGSSPSGSTIELNKEWEQDKDSGPTDAGAAGHKGIMRTVKITQM